MHILNNKKGFTLLELTVVIMILGILIAITTDKSNISNAVTNSNQANIVSTFVAIESSFNDYYSAKSAYPTGLADATFVPSYLTPPRPPTGFDTTYGTGGILLANQTGQPVNQNGHYISLKTSVTGQDIIWNSIAAAGAKLPATKFFYNTTAPALTNMTAPAGAATVYLTYWIDPN